MGADAHAVAALWPAAEGHPADDNVTAVLPPDRTGSGRSAVAAGAGDPCDALSGRDGLDRPHTPRPGAGELLPAGRRRVGRSRTGIVPPDAARDARRRAPACAAAASCPPRPRRCVCGSLVRRSPEIEVYVHERGAGHLVDPTRRLEDRAAEAVRLRHRSPVWRVPAGFRVATSPYAWPRLRSRGLPAHWHRIRRRPGGRADHPPTVERADDAADPAAGRRRRGRTRVDQRVAAWTPQRLRTGQVHPVIWRAVAQCRISRNQQFRSSRHRDDRYATRSDSRRPRAPGRLHVPHLHMHRNVLC